MNSIIHRSFHLLDSLLIQCLQNQVPIIPIKCKQSFLSSFTTPDHYPLSIRTCCLGITKVREMTYKITSRRNLHHAVFSVRLSSLRNTTAPTNMCSYLFHCLQTLYIPRERRDHVRSATSQSLIDNGSWRLGILR